MKTKRHQKIIELINSEVIKTQEELAQKLVENGYNVTQATVSRDIKELKLAKVHIGNGLIRYAVSDNRKSANMSILYESVLSAEAAVNIVVVKTITGMAQGVANFIDHMHIEHLVGSIAGDDTIMLIAKTEPDAERICGRLAEFARGE